MDIKRTVLILGSILAIAMMVQGVNAQINSASIDGYIFNETGAPLAGALVEWRNNATSELIGNSTSTSDGFYFMNHMYDGTVESLITASKSGYVPNSTVISMTAAFPPAAYHANLTLTQIPADTTPPYTSGHSPAPGATDVPVDTNIVVHVRDDRPGDSGVDQLTIGMTVEGAPVVPTITGTPADYTLTYDPPANFGYSQVVDVTIDASDLAGNVMMPSDAYSFTTASVPDTTPPNITLIYPADGATGVLINTPILARFSEPMNTASVEAAFSLDGITGSFAWHLIDTVMVFTPAADLTPNTLYTAIIAATATDLAGNGLDGNENGIAEGSPIDDYIWSFTTATPADTIPPYTSGHSPAPGATDVPVDTNIVVHVRDDRPGDSGVDQLTIGMTVEGAPVVPTITGTPADYTLTYDPPANFGYSQVVDVTIDASDLAGNVMMPSDAYSFTTASAPAPPAVPLLGLPAIIALACILGILVIALISRKKTKK